MVSLRLRGLGEAKKYSLQHALKKTVNFFNENVNVMLKAENSLVLSNSFRTFALRLREIPITQTI